jgi:hypothetical protein
MGVPQNQMKVALLVMQVSHLMTRLARLVIVYLAAEIQITEGVSWAFQLMGSG